MVHSRIRQRCKCRPGGRPFSYRRGTLFYGWRRTQETVMRVLALVAAFELDERTLARWVSRAGDHAYVFHRQPMRRLDLGQVQVDELRLKLQGRVLWVAMALAVGSRLWPGVVCRATRDKTLAQQIMTWVYGWALHVPLRISFDGWAAYASTCARGFREECYNGRGRARLVAWACLTLVRLVKHTATGRFRPRRLVVSGSCTMRLRLLERSQGAGVINTAYSERLFATFRARLAVCTRHPARHLAMVESHLYLVGCLYNFCRLHTSLRTRTPAMAADLTDHLWSFSEFFWWRPLPYWASTV